MRFAYNIHNLTVIVFRCPAAVRWESLQRFSGLISVCSKLQQEQDQFTNALSEYYRLSVPIPIHVKHTYD